MDLKSEDELRAEIAHLKSRLARREVEFEEALAQEHRKTLQQISSGLSHNLNNLLTGILLQAEIAASNATDPESLACLNDIVKTGHRAAALISRLETSARDDILEPPDSIDLNALIDVIVEDAAPGRAIEVDLHTIPEIRAVKSEVSDAVRDLVQNAIDATPPGGAITLTTRHVSGDVRVEIIDNGVGMNLETAKRATDPFYTTKRNVGSGLGLSTVHGIVKRSEGRLEIASEEGKGTRVTLSFPVPGGVSA